jgi:hypothetical protein
MHQISRTTLLPQALKWKATNNKMAKAKPAHGIVTQNREVEMT